MGINRIAVEGAVPVECPHGYDACPQCDWDGVGKQPAAIAAHTAAGRDSRMTRQIRSISQGQISSTASPAIDVNEIYKCIYECWLLRLPCKGHPPATK